MYFFSNIVISFFLLFVLVVDFGFDIDELVSLGSSPSLVGALLPQINNNSMNKTGKTYNDILVVIFVFILLVFVVLVFLFVSSTLFILIFIFLVVCFRFRRGCLLLIAFLILVIYSGFACGISIGRDVFLINFWRGVEVIIFRLGAAPIVVARHGGGWMEPVSRQRRFGSYARR